MQNQANSHAPTWYVPDSRCRRECDCGDPNPVFDSATHEEICVNCGVVIESVLCSDPGFKHDHHEAFDPVNSRLQTYIDNPGISKRVFASMTVDPWNAEMTKRETMMKDVCLSMRIEVPSVISKMTLEFYNIVVAKGYVRGPFQKTTMAACMYFACRSQQCDREITHISGMCGVNIRGLYDCVKNAKAALMDVPQLHERVCSRSFTPLVLKIVAMLDLTDGDRKTLQRETLKILENNEDARDSGKKPRTLVAGATCIAARACGINVSKTDVSKASGTCLATIDKLLSANVLHA